MTRLEPLTPPYPPEIAEKLSSMMPPGIEPLRLFRTLAHNPRILDKIRSSNLLDRGSITRVEREIAILRTCARCRSEYEWGVHVAVFGRRLGIPESKLEGTVLWASEDPRWSAAERAIVRLADELHETSTISEELWTALTEVFEADQIVELLVLIGFYHTISFVTNGISIELEESAERFPAVALAEA